MTTTQWIGLALLVAIALATAFSYVTLLDAPAPFVDEAWNANRALALIQTGHAFGSLDAGVFERFAGYANYFPFLGTWIHSLAIRALGPTLFAVRFTSFLFGITLLGSVYFIGRQVGSHLIGLVAAFLVATSNSFLLSTHIGRHDAVAAAIGFGAIGLYVSDRSPGWSARSVIAGLAIGLTLDIHPNGMIFGPAMTALYLFDDSLRFLKTRRFWGFFAGVSVGIAYYVVDHVLPDSQSYATLGRPFGPWRAPPLVSIDPNVWWEALSGLAIQTARLSDVRLPLFAVAFVFVLLRGASTERKFAAIYVSLALSFLALIKFTMIYYLILIQPAADLLLAAYLVRLLSFTRVPGPMQLLGILLAGLMLVIAGARSAQAFEVDHQSPYLASAVKVAAAVGSTGTILGTQLFWFALTDRRYLSWEQLVYYRLFVPGSTLDDAFVSLHPDYLILDRQVDQYVNDDPTALSRFARFLAVSRGELNQELDRRADLVASFDTIDDGQVRVYRFRWSP